MKFSKSKLALLGLAAMLATAGARAAEADAEAQDQAIEELRTMLGTTVAQLNDMKGKMDNGVNFGVNADMRYDYQKWNAFAPQTAGGYVATGRNYVLASPTDGAATGITGFYSKRMEVEFKAKTASWAQWHLQFDFAGLKLEDLGVELNELPFFPGMDSGTWNWGMKIGQFRQPFGIEQQTGSSSIAFSERAMMYGGSNPTGAAKIVTERVMGLHLWQAHDFGMFGYKLQFSVANDNGDQNPGSNSLAGSVFPTTNPAGVNKDFPYAGQQLDQDPAEFGRLGLDLNFMPKIVKINVGASAIHNSTDTVIFANFGTGTQGAQYGEQNTYGVDATLQSEMLNWKVWGEFVKFDKSTGGNTSVALGGPASAGWNFVTIASTEGWYITSCMNPLKFFMKDAPMIDFNVRYDNYISNVDTAANQKTYLASSSQAITYGLKWNYVGKNYTSLNYTIFGLNGDFSSLAGTDLFVLQQQFNF